MANPTNSDLNNPLVFFNHIRYLMILFVLLCHSSMSYSNLPIKWYVVDSGSSQFFDIYLLLCDVFVMTILFFIAGYFAIPSLQRKGTAAFLKNKFKRLGVPLLLGVTLLGPIMPYIRKVQFSTGDISFSSYFWFWIGYLKSAGHIYVGPTVSKGQFSHFYFWYLSLLLAFFIVFCLLYKVRSKRLHSSTLHAQIGNTSSAPTLKVLLLFGILTTVGFFTVITFVPDRQWYTIGNLLFFQPTRLVLYISYFSLGIYAYSKKWFINGDAPRFFIFWLLICGLLIVGYLAMSRVLVEERSTELLFLFSLIRSFLCLSFLIVFTSFASRFWNRSSKVDKGFSENSYTIYIVHPPIVVFFQFFLSNWELDWENGVWIKFGLVAVLSLILSYGISSYLIKSFVRFR